MSMKKQTSDYPKFTFRIDKDLWNWLRDYARRRNKSMSAIIKEHLTKLREEHNNDNPRT